MTRLLLGIDEGTTAVKVVAYDLELRELRAARRRVPVSHPRPGWVEKGAEAVLDAVVDGVAEVLEPGDEVVACGLDHEGESVLAWDAGSGRPLTPVVVWQDKRSEAVLARLDAAAIQARSGLPLDPYFSAGKLAWLLEQDPRLSDARLGTLDAFLRDRLGAGFATDPSTVSRTQLGLERWDPWLLEVFGVPAGALPEIADSAGDLGTLCHSRWPVDLPLRASVVDQQAALAGAGCVTPGAVKATYGTGVFVLAHAGAGRPDADGLLPTVAWRIGGRTDWALDGGVFSAGALLEWLTGELGLAPDPAALARLAATVDDAGGVRMLPALAGLGAPWWRPQARGVIAGVTAATTPAHLARAALEAIAWRVADILECLPVATVLRVDGGLTNDDLLVQLQADVAGVPVARGAVDATAAGAAALAGVGAGLWELETIAQLVQTGAPQGGRRDAAWRSREHRAWRDFAQAAAALPR